MSIGSTDTVKNAPPPPRDPGAASPKQVKEFNEAVDRSTTSNNSSQQSQGASTSAPIMLARRPPIPAQTPQQTLTCATPTAQQKARAFVDPALRDVAAGKKEIAKNAKGTDSRQDAGSPADGRLQAAQVRCGRKVRRRDGQGAEEVPDRPLPEGYRTSRQADHGAAQHRIHQVPRIRQAVCRWEAQHHHRSRLR